ncbi:MAG: N-acetylmuramoyl-L-alanine amidase, partial [Allobaculum sp.]|nr:N-acetylmuramoyl-L-alanine amidase [Allobaculum sp.]
MAQKHKKKKKRLKKSVRLFLRFSTIVLCLMSLMGLQAKFNLWQVVSNANILEVFVKGMDFASTSQLESTSQVETITTALEPIPTPIPVVELEPIAIILVDPGHGGLDSGTIATNPYNENEMIYESTLNLQAAYEFKECMGQINPRIQVVFTRSSEQSTVNESIEEFDEVTDLNNRVAMIDQYHADYFLSLHCNAANDLSLYGYELFVKSSDTFSNTLTQYVASEFDQIHWPLGNGILWTDYYPLHVVDLAKVPAMLVEMGYMSHEGELANLVNGDTRRALMFALAKSYSDCIMANPPQS